MEVRSPVDPDKVATILETLSPRPPPGLAEEVVQILHRYHVMLQTVQRATPSKLRKEMKEIVALTKRPGGQLLKMAGTDCSDAALRCLSLAQRDYESLRKTAERCLETLQNHPRGPQETRPFDSFVIYQLRQAFQQFGIKTTSHFTPSINEAGGEHVVKNTGTRVIFQLIQLLTPYLSEQGFRKRWFYTAGSRADALAAPGKTALTD